MSTALFDLGQRLRSAHLGRPVKRSRYVPLLEPQAPVAVTITGRYEQAFVQATDGSRVCHASGASALLPLVELGVSINVEPRTLVIADRDSLDHLLQLAIAADPTSEAGDAAAVVGWWAQRADHPGSCAVLNVPAACSARWVLGVPPALERHVDVWRQWLGVHATGPAGLLELARLVSAGDMLPGLEAFAEDDRHSWDSFAARLRDPTTSRDWRARDSRREAALGLAARCDAAELYDSLRLSDPLVATRESFGGMVVTGVVLAQTGRNTVQVLLDRLTCRLREHAAVEGYHGFPIDLPPAGAQSPVLRGIVASSRLTADEHLVLTIQDAILRPAQLRLGQRLTLRPRLVDPRQQRSGRQELHRRYATRRSWVSGGPPPVPRRRDVPLDVAIAAAE